MMWGEGVCYQRRFQLHDVGEGMCFQHRFKLHDVGGGRVANGKNTQYFRISSQHHRVGIQRIKSTSIAYFIVMKCVKLAKTSPPSAVKDGLRHIHEMSAQHAFEKFLKEDISTRLALILSNSQTTGERVATLGSDGMVYCHKDDGIFSAVLAAYNNHWKLRTSPDDWWLCVVKKVSLAIDKNAEKPTVRNVFVKHKGKETLSVDVPTTCIYDIDYR